MSSCPISIPVTLGHVNKQNFFPWRSKRSPGTPPSIKKIWDEPEKGSVMLLDEEKSTPISPSEIDKPILTRRGEAGRKGGSMVRDKYGEDYFRRIGKKGGMTLKEKRGSEYYRSIAQKGGQANVARYGPDHFSEMGKKGGNTTKQRQDADFYSRIGKLGGTARRRNKQ